MSKCAVGFIGIGKMGEPMAQNLVKAGYRVKVWSRSPEKVRNLTQAGAEPCATARDAARRVAALICMLSDGPTCNEVLFGKEGAIEGMERSSTLIVMSSIPVTTAVEQGRWAGERGLGYLDAPVSGGQKGARDASLAIMAGGEEKDFEANRGILKAMGHPVRVGPVGTGELAKLANQLIVASTIAAVAEALLFVERGGADPAKVQEALSGGFADSPIMRLHGRRMIERNFVPGGSAKWQLKDTRTVLAHAQTLKLSLPVASLVDSLFEAMIAHGDGELDHSGLIRELLRRNGLAVDS
jgi:3-hydroxyisobutyrate dehydrogenase-like beta-hydroxyacid dehydrogenase